MASAHRPKGRTIYRMKFIDQHGVEQTRSTGMKDRRAAEGLANMVERDAELIRAGKEPQNLPLTAEYLGIERPRRGVPWADAVEAFLAELARRGSGPGSSHHRDMRCHLKKWGEACRWRVLEDVRAADISWFLGELQAANKAPRTQNHYLVHLNQMLDWCIRPQRWLIEHPGAEIEKARVGAGGRRRLRRAYTAEEWPRLLAAAPNYRRVIYQVAAFSGLRRSELRRLQKQDCTPQGTCPRWHVRPEVCKNGLAANLPMLPDCAAVLAPVWESRPQPGSPIFRAVPHMELVHEDLEKAGIPRQDARGRWADFHSFRYTFCTWMAKRHPIQTVQRLMRHGTITLTVDLYNDLDLNDMAEQLWSLPPLFPAEGGNRAQEPAA